MNIDLDDHKSDFIVSHLRDWYHENRRVLPWRERPEPYRVWVSEIMLQQTRVSVVVPYFVRWMERFPTIRDLAESDLDDVLALWSGLGYYRRARMLHRAAGEVMERWGGELPGDVKGLLTIPGIGRYTAGAIASIALGLPAPIVDGNVIRILCRWFAIDADPTASSTQKVLWKLAETLVPKESPGDFNQAMMELGATVCTPKKPMCLLCPVSEICEARAAGMELVLPRAKAKTKKRSMFVATLLLRDPTGEKYAVVQRPSEGLFGGLWEFPGLEVSTPSGRKPSRKKARSALQAWLASCALSVEFATETPDVQHLLSHIKLTHIPWVGILAAPYTETTLDGRPLRWISSSDLDSIGLASVMRKVLAGAESA